MSRRPNPAFHLDNSLAPPAAAPGLVRQLGLFDATMVVMGGIVGAGIFINPYVVARQVHSPALILGAWLLGGLIALAGAFVYAELAARLPQVGGQYAYLREAYHPAAAFLYGWVLLLVTQAGGMAAVAVTFARYFLELIRVPLPDWALAAIVLAALTVINCFGAKAGSNVQSALMVTKIVAIGALVFCGALFVSPSPDTFRSGRAWLDRPASMDLVTSFGAAMVPVLFAFGGWQTSNFIAGEVREPRKNLPRGLLLGVTGVIVLYLSVNYVCVRGLGAEGLAATSTPASTLMRRALGERGANLLAVGIAASTLGFLSQSILTAPRVYFAMAEDGLFFRSAAWLHPRTHVPVVAIVVQGVWATVVVMSGRYEQILSYVVSMDFLFFGLTATCLFVFRRRESAEFAIRDSGFEAGGGKPRATGVSPAYRMPGHPLTTLLFVAACWLVVANTVYKYPINTSVGVAILLAGVPMYILWSRRSGKSNRSDFRGGAADE